MGRALSMALLAISLGCGGGAESSPVAPSSDPPADDAGAQLDADGGAVDDGGSADAPAWLDVAVDLGDPLCGNGRLDDGEECDPSAGARCIRVCDAPTCWTGVLVHEGTCRQTCEAVPIVACASGDGCCPEGCGAEDSDCR